MSLMIKGINRPKEGEMIVIGIWPTDAVVDTWDTREVDGEDIFIKREHIKHADIIQIPKDHGRIGDIDEIIKKLPTEYLGSTAHAIINEAPAILEEEGTE